jgi:hypothetical protein
MNLMSEQPSEPMCPSGGSERANALVVNKQEVSRSQQQWYWLLRLSENMAE